MYRLLALVLALWLVILILGVCLPAMVSSMAGEVVVDCGAIQREGRAIGEIIIDQGQRIQAIANRTTTGTTTVSYYSDWFVGRKTASGIIFDQDSRQIAHRSLPFGTIIVLTAGNKTSWGVVTDRGPFVEGRDFDVSRLIMSELGGIENGILNCDVLVIRKEK